ncbi:uncharacterized protein DUF955 [Herbihabitans rhizosphaerae]|uniref:Uncharacterized protein DUF955 n=1 Tax=Herbihabitans rhizosphaerae TaxID=1872711 RepID=A0A4Q7L4D9_9PSEU|nr:ImmA/IrrE family metallo-endopeptidase [Herbihabitans rhizosphaerae]RZS44488.1 uncharacterized protein DUF955 [Herbihabitans rhizosphaerae]
MPDRAHRGDSIAARLNWLFDVVAQPVDDRTWRSFTTAEVGRALAEALGDDERAGQATVERIRTGAQARDDQLAAIAAFFGVGPEFFGNDLALVDAARDDLLTRALTGCGAQPYSICRMPVPAVERREQLRRALRPVPAALRSTERTEPRPSQGQGDHFGGSDRDSGTAMTAARMTADQLHALCRALVHDLGLRTPFTPRELCQRLGERRDRPIEVRAIDLAATTGVGHLAPLPDADHILVERDAPAPQQAVVIYHEVIHLVRGHLDIGDTMTCGLPAGEDTADAYDDWREWEAEVGARTLSRLARERPRPNQLSREASPADHSIAAAFGFALD